MKFFQRTFLLVLVASLMIQSFAKTAVAVYWSINQEWIAKNLCENRLEKKSCCEGSCQLKKWTVEEKRDSEGQTQIPNLLLLKEIDSFFEPKTDFAQLFFPPKEDRPKRFLTDDRLPSAPFLDAIGMPPDLFA